MKADTEHRWEITKNATDDLMNLIEVTVQPNHQIDQADLLDDDGEPLLGVQVMNRHCYIPSLVENEPMLRRSVELRARILQDLFGWDLLMIDEDGYRAQGDKEAKLNYLRERMLTGD